MRRTKRPGYTILELLVVLALIVILGAVIIPSLAGYYGNTKQRAATDLVRTRLAEARAKAMERGTPFRVAVNEDKTRLRVAPDGDDFEGMQADTDPPAYDAIATEDKIDGATLEVILDPDDDRPQTPGGWITVATMRPDGTSKEARASIVSIKQQDFPAIHVQVRGLTGQARTAPAPKNGSQP